MKKTMNQEKWFNQTFHSAETLKRRRHRRRKVKEKFHYRSSVADFAVYETYQAKTRSIPAANQSHSAVFL